MPGAAAIRAIQGNARNFYGLTFEADLLRSRYIWRAPVTVPGYEVSALLRIELRPPDAYLPVRVYVEEGPQPERHKWPDDALCMWHPKDPPERRWSHDDGLLKLIDSAVVHLFKELYYQEHPEVGWLADEIHGQPKPQAMAVSRAAA